jgi:hypothetical protein
MVCKEIILKRITLIVCQQRATNEWNNFGGGKAWRWDTQNASIYPQVICSYFKLLYSFVLVSLFMGLNVPNHISIARYSLWQCVEVETLQFPYPPKVL